MVETFSDVFAENTACARMDARVKLLIAVPTIIAVVTSPTSLFPLVILVVGLAALLASALPVSYLAVRMSAPLGLIVTAVLIKAATTGTTPLWQVSIGSSALSISREGLIEGGRIAARALGAITVVLFVGTTTPAHTVFAALRGLGLPADWIDLAQMMYRYIFMFADRAADIAGAQRVRLGYTGLRRSIRSLGTLTGALLTGSVEQVIRTSESMRVRGYTGRMPHAPLPPLSRKDILLVLGVNTILWTHWAVCARLRLL